MPGTGDEATAGLALRWPLPPACPPHTDTLLSRDIQARGINLPYVPGDGEGSTPGEKHVCRDWGAGFPQELLEQLRQASTAQLVAGDIPQPAVIPQTCQALPAAPSQGRLSTCHPTVASNSHLQRLGLWVIFLIHLERNVVIGDKI